jgi:hypothetical protein
MTYKYLLHFSAMNALRTHSSNPYYEAASTQQTLCSGVLRSYMRVKLLRSEQLQLLHLRRSKAWCYALVLHQFIGILQTVQISV